jgi:16S rRNA (uracil1498-N3)-methyltransferase
MSAPRLYVTADLGAGLGVALGPEAAGYLSRVLRKAPGAEVALFNGRDGEWRARLEAADKKGARLACVAQARAQTPPGDVWLVFAPVKRQGTDWIVEKATELGAAVLQPVLTQRTVAETVRLDRLEAIAREAAEQCERLDVPEIRAPLPLAKLIDQWPADRALMFADEGGDAPPLLSAVQRGSQPLALLIGPEGGFAPIERQMLRAHAQVTPVTLGPLILRAETAAVAGLALLQAASR